MQPNINNAVHIYEQFKDETEDYIIKNSTL